MFINYFYFSDHEQPIWSYFWSLSDLFEKNNLSESFLIKCTELLDPTTVIYGNGDWYWRGGDTSVNIIGNKFQQQVFNKF